MSNLNDEIQKTLLISIKDKMLHVVINNPSKRNALSTKHLEYLTEEMEKAKTNNDISCVYITGTGDFFTSGNDFNNFTQNKTKDEMAKGFADFIDFLIFYPKILIAGINGTCIGMGFTMLMHFDIIIASANAIFLVPFIQTLQTPEGTSSFTFPLMFGKVAGHLLYKGDAINSEEAKNFGLVSKIFDVETFSEESYGYAKEVADKPLHSLLKYKEMIKRYSKEKLSDINHYEARELRQSWENPEFKKIIAKFVKKAKF